MKILWIAAVWPEPNSSAAGYRTAQWLEVLQNAGHQVNVSSPCSDNPYREELNKRGYQTSVFLPNDSLFDAFIAELQPDVVFFDRFMLEEQFSWRVREQSPGALRILDTIDLHSVRRARERAIKTDRSAQVLTADDLASEDALRELASIYRSDLSLIISDYELSLLQNHYQVPASLLQLCRFSYPPKTSQLGFDSRKHFVSIGNFNHPPNADSFRLLHDVIWPQIRKALTERGEREIELHLYGSYPKREFSALDNPKTGFRVKGIAEDALATLEQYRVNLAPLRFGAGIKGKIADGWAAGTPCVTTPIGAEGMCEGFSFGGRVVETWEDFAQCAVELYCDASAWKDAQQKAALIVNNLFSPTIYQEALAAIDRCVTKRDENRRANFIGSMLWHHQMRSSEFFSRWIEAKNKLTPRAEP